MMIAIKLEQKRKNLSFQDLNKILRKVKLTLIFKELKRIDLKALTIKEELSSIIQDSKIYNITTTLLKISKTPKIILLKFLKKIKQIIIIIKAP